LIDAESTAANPATPPSNLTALDVQANQVEMGWTNGNGEGRLVVFSEDPLNATPENGVNYSPSSNYGSGTLIGNGFVVARGDVTAATVSQLLAGVTYYVNVFEYNGYSLAPAFNTTPLSGTVTTIGAPLESATDPVIQSPSTTSVRIAWTNGSGQKRIVLGKQGVPVDEAPIDDVIYAANPVFGSGDNLRLVGNFVVYADTGSEVTVSGLTPGEEYYFSIFEYNEIGSIVRYRRINPALISTNDISLPVELTSFTGEVTTNNTVLLNWATTTETNNDYFAVEVSRNGIDFSEVNRVMGAGTTDVPQGYSYEYNQAASGLVYFRLKQVDFDNSYTFSNIISLSLDATITTIAYPNPTSDLLVVKGLNVGKGNIALVSASGKVWQPTIDVISNDYIELEVSDLPVGMYLLRLPTGQVLRIAVNR